MFKSRLSQLVFIVIGLMMIVGLSKNILRLLKVDDRIEEIERNVAELRQKNQELKEAREYYSSDEFVEKEARNRLNLAKPGETMVILPSNLAEILGRKDNQEVRAVPNWKKWWDLFF